MSSAKTGFPKRLAPAVREKSFEMIEKTAHDIFEQELLIPNNVDVEFTRTKPSLANGYSRQR